MWNTIYISLTETLSYFFQGPERVKSLYAFRTMIDSGARVTLGSDAPVEDVNPISGFYAAITRLSPSGQSPHGSDGWLVYMCIFAHPVLICPK